MTLDGLAIRAKVLRALREFFWQHDFLEVETPTRVPSPGLDLHLDAFPSEDRWLITSPEYQMKRLLAAGATRIVQVGRCFRKGEIGAHHEPEFTMAEWYRAPASMSDVMADTEALVAFVTKSVLGTTVLPCGADVASPWERLRVEDAFRRYAQVEVRAVLPDEERFFRLLIEKVEPALLDRPVFLTHWPASMASLARIDPNDPNVCERFEAYVGGLELCNGFGELVDPVEQRARLERDQEARRRAGKVVYPIDERFLGALEKGIPPSGGNALGVDRLAMLVAGASCIQDVVAISDRDL